jgi:excisionase family DNA binding protein
VAHEGEASEHSAGGGIAHLPAGAGAHNQHPRRLWMACEVAEVLRLSTKGVYALAERGALPSVKVGSRLRFDPVDILEWVSQHRRVR